MTVAGLLVKLMLMFPRGFGASEALESWEEVYRDALGKFEGQVLDIAYKAVMRGWTKSSPPKPGDFLERCVSSAPAESRPRDPGSGRNMKLIGEKRSAMIPVLRREWWQNHQGFVDEFLATIDPQDHALARIKIGWRVERQAEDVAMALALDRSAAIVLTDDDLEKIRGTLSWTRDIDKPISMRGIIPKVPNPMIGQEPPAPEIPGPGEPPL